MKGFQISRIQYFNSMKINQFILMTYFFINFLTIHFLLLLIESAALHEHSGLSTSNLNMLCNIKQICACSVILFT